MAVIEEFIQEYETLKASNERMQKELTWYIEKFNALGQQLGVDPATLLHMKVVSAESQKQAWSGKEVFYIALEREAKW